jgi:hypothetical protein
MTWYTQTLEIADEKGNGINKFRHTARSDDPTSEIIGLCEHEHDTQDDAYTCPTAIINEGMVTGIPRMDAPQRC